MKTFIVMRLGCSAGLVAFCAVATPAAAQVSYCVHSPVVAAFAVYVAVSQQDGDGLAKLVHPDRGVRVSPSVFVDPETDLTLERDDVARLWTDEAIRDWGYSEGSGDPITLTGAGYVAAYVTDNGFDTPVRVLVGGSDQTGGTVNNATDVYADAAIVEFRSEGNAASETDWTALRMAFVFDEDGCNRLVGLISDRWAP